MLVSIISTVGVGCLILLHTRHLREFYKQFNPIFQTHSEKLTFFCFLLIAVTDVFKSHFDNTIVEFAFAIVAFFTLIFSLLPYINIFLCFGTCLAVSWLNHHLRHWILINLMMISYVSFWGCILKPRYRTIRYFFFSSVTLHSIMFLFGGIDYFTMYRAVPVSLWIPLRHGGFDTSWTWYCYVIPLILLVSFETVSWKDYLRVMCGIISYWIGVYVFYTSKPPILLLYIWFFPLAQEKTLPM